MSVFQAKCLDGQIEALTDFFGVHKNLCEIRWTRTNKRETVRVVIPEVVPDDPFEGLTDDKFMAL